MLVAISVRHIMRTKVATCTCDTTVYDACVILAKIKTSTVVVIDENKAVLGVFSERDLVDRVVVAKKDPLTTKVADVMTAPVVCGDISQTDMDIARVIVREHVKKIPILDNGQLVGIVAEYDLLKYLAASINEDG